MTTATRNPVRYFDADSTDELSRFVLLASHLPRGGGPATAAKCKHCGQFLGALINAKGLVSGSFTRGTELQGVARFDQTVTLTCTKCGKARTFSFNKR